MPFNLNDHDHKVTDAENWYKNAVIMRFLKGKVHGTAGRTLKRDFVANVVRRTGAGDKEVARRFDALLESRTVAAQHMRRDLEKLGHRDLAESLVAHVRDFSRVAVNGRA